MLTISSLEYLSSWRWSGSPFVRFNLLFVVKQRFFFNKTIISWILRTNFSTKRCDDFSLLITLTTFYLRAFDHQIDQSLDLFFPTFFIRDFFRTLWIRDFFFAHSRFDLSIFEVFLSIFRLFSVKNFRTDYSSNFFSRHFVFRTLSFGVFLSTFGHNTLFAGSRRRRSASPLLPAFVSRCISTL